jgi:Nif-specific ferredoxin III
LVNDSVLTGLTRGGETWVPQFLQSIDPTQCIGCGRCYKACGRDVMALVEHTGEDEAESMIMTVANPENCIGCQACSRACTRRCHSYAPGVA